ncbi:MAG: TMEM14 family protein [Candidatus Obscuribacterales bacterium]|nr:TMEM14 family protein [Candidatus Obscuribacterales bacterium]
MNAALQISMLVYGILIAVGGVFGFLKAKSKASLIAGVISGALMITAYSVSNRNLRQGLLFGAIVCSVLAAVFLMRLAKTKKFMPSGMLLILTTIEEFALFLGYFMME